MINRDVRFIEYGEKTQKLLNQALVIALTKVNEEAIMFPLYADNMKPTEAEAEHAAEVIKTAVLTQTIYHGAQYLIAKTLLFIATDLSNWIGDSLSPIEACAEYEVINGMEVTLDTVNDLKSLAIRIDERSVF